MLLLLSLSIPCREETGARDERLCRTCATSFMRSDIYVDFFDVVSSEARFKWMVVKSFMGCSSACSWKPLATFLGPDKC